MRPFCVFIAFICILSIGCSTEKKKINNPSNLPTQVVTIDPAKDTSFKTNRGALIKIPKDALVADGQKPIQIEIKEAYNISEMILGGLVTRADDVPLSSGGMIYLNAVEGNNVRIIKPISVAIPSPSLDPNMQLYKGEIEADGMINCIISPFNTLPAAGAEDSNVKYDYAPSR